MTKRFCMLLLAAVLSTGAAACNDTEGDAQDQAEGEVTPDSADGIK